MAKFTIFTIKAVYCNLATLGHFIAKYCGQRVHNSVPPIVHKTIVFTQLHTPRLPAQTLSPIPSTAAAGLHTICTRIFHTHISKITPVIEHLSPRSTGPITITTIYITNK